MADALDVVPKDGEVELSVDQYLLLLSQAHSARSESRSVEPSPVDFFVSTLDITGAAEDDNVNLVFTFAVDVLSDQRYLSIPLLPASLVLVSADVVHSRPDVDGSVEARSAGVAISGGHYNVFLIEAGHYVVRLEMLSPYASIYKSSFKVSLPTLATSSQLNFTVPRESLQINVTNAHSVESTEADGQTHVTCALPPTSTLEVQWTQAVRQVIQPIVPTESAAEAAAAAKKKKKEAIVTVGQSLLCLIGEGVMAITCQLRYSLGLASRSVFEVKLQKDVHVISVDGQNLRRWEVVEDALTRGGAEANYNVLRVTCTHPVEREYSLTLIAEKELAGTTCECSVPTIRCADVSRERGHVGVGARTNVEISEAGRRSGQGLNKVDVSELPAELMSMAGGVPLLLSFRYLSTGYKIGLQVTKHADVEVLVAAIDAMQITVWCTAEGKQLFRVQANVRNNARQFLRMRLPAVHEVWSTVVRGTPVKPATDEEHRLLIPLAKSDGAIVVDVTYLLRREAFGDGGNLVVETPVVDIPISHLFLELCLPSRERYKYEDDELTGDLKLTDYFSVIPNFSVSADTTRAQAQQQVQASRQRNTRMRRRTSICMMDSDSCSSSLSDSDDDEGDMDDLDIFVPVDKGDIGGGVGGGGGGMGGGPSTSTGVIPISVVHPRIHDAAIKRFEQLLVGTEEGAKVVSLPFTKIETSSGGRCC